MKTIYIQIVGHNASGKTYLAKKLESDLQINRLNADDFRQYIKNTIRYYNDLDVSYKNDKFDSLVPVALAYREHIVSALLSKNQGVLVEGGGFLKKWRLPLLKAAKLANPDVVTILISTKINETELLQRLKIRDQEDSTNRWTSQYLDHKKSVFEPPSTDEADKVLVYSQDNYEEILRTIKEIN